MKPTLALLLAALGMGLVSAADDLVHVTYRPVYETVQDVSTKMVTEPMTDTVMKDCTFTVYRQVCETRFREETFMVCKPVTEMHRSVTCVQVCKPVCETVVKECCEPACKPVCETTWKEVCRTEMRWVCEKGTKEVCRHVAERVTESVPVCRRVPVTECKPCCDNACNACCKKRSVCEKLGECWQAYGDWLGNCGARLGAHMLNKSHKACCSSYRIPDSVSACGITRYETVTEQKCVTKTVRRDVTVKVPTVTIRRVPVKVIDRVPVTTTRMVPCGGPKWVSTTRHRTAQGAYIDRASLVNPDGVGDTVLGAAANGCLKPDAVTYESGEAGRVFVEGLQVKKEICTPVTRMVRTCETRRVPETVTNLVPETVTKQVPTTVTRTVTKEIRTCTPKVVCRLEKVPSHGCETPKCSVNNCGAKCDGCAGKCNSSCPSCGNEKKLNCGCECPCRPHPVRDFLDRLRANRLCCQPCKCN